jgi:hypothetical protein
MRFTDKLVEKYGIDKLLHFLGGGWIVSIFTPLGWLGIILGLILMLILSLAKELFFDSSFDKNDIAAACIGGGASVIVYAMILLFNTFW